LKLDEQWLAKAFSLGTMYFPIPFAKRCRMEWTGKLPECHVYQFGVRLYEPGTPVKTFVPQDLLTYRAKIERLIDVMSNVADKYPMPETVDRKSVDVRVEPGKTVEALAFDSGGALVRLSLRAKAADLKAALRQTVLHIRFDGWPRAQVQCPVGDFFGSGPGVNPLNSLPMTVEPDGTMTCRFVMPFQKSCTMRFQNLGEQPVEMVGEVLVAPYQWDPDRSMHFYCRWRVHHDLLAGPGQMAQDLPVLFARGQGVYVGTAVMLMNPNACPSGDGNWWGEGDERVFIDDDTTRPSLAGTGTEDYFNFGWGSPHIFSYAYSGQTRNDGPANRGHVSNYRWHIADPLPFRNSIAFLLELASHRATPGFSYARACYYYGRPGVIDDHVSIPGRDLFIPVIPAWMPEAVSGASQSVFFQAEDTLRHGNARAVEAGPQWAGNKLLVWQPSHPGEELSLEFPVKEDGKYFLALVFRQNNKGGTIFLRLNDQPLPLRQQKQVNLYEPHRMLSRAWEAVPIDLNAGTQQLVIRFEGPPPNATDAEIGLDFVWLRKIAGKTQNNPQANQQEDFPKDVQTMFYKARSKFTGNMWDTWLYRHEGTYYLYTLGNAGPKWDNISMASSPDGVHWTEIGRVLAKGPGVTWMGTGSVWKSPNFQQDGKFFMNFSEWKGPRQTIFFAESQDLVHWTRLGNQYEFVQDERWYEANGRWDCIWTLPRPDGGLYGYWTANAKPETGGRFGFGETLDGITWSALAPPTVEGMGNGEVGAIAPLGGKYYMMFGSYPTMWTLVADEPTGPFRPATKNRTLLSQHTYFSRFLELPDALLVNHHAIARDGQVYFSPLKEAVLDSEGTLRLGWWSGNERMKHDPIDVRLPTQIAPAESMVLLENTFDFGRGVILEGQMVMPEAGGQRRGLYIGCGPQEGGAVLVDSNGIATFGTMTADGATFRSEKTANREMTFASPARFRLLVKGPLMEVYLNDILLECFSLPAAASGKIGLITGGDPSAFSGLGAWH
ncbi:MAG: DUF2961 domain-containing protein, partial [Kiritimatiellia bacterium]